MKLVKFLWIHSAIIFFVVSTYGQNAELKAIRAVATDSVNLKCQKNNERDILWNYNDQPLFVNGVYHGPNQGRFALDDKYADNHNLMITNLKKTDTGTYECIGLTSSRMLAGYNLTVLVSNQQIEQLSTTSEQRMYSMQETSEQSSFSTNSMTNIQQIITTPQMNSETTPEPTTEPEMTDNGGSSRRLQESIIHCIVLLIIGIIL